MKTILGITVFITGVLMLWAAYMGISLPIKCTLKTSGTYVSDTRQTTRGFTWVMATFKYAVGENIVEVSSRQPVSLWYFNRNIKGRELCDLYVNPKNIKQFILKKSFDYTVLILIPMGVICLILGWYGIITR